MESYKLIVSYVGTQYQGWQAQPNGKTVSQTMQKSFEKTFQTPCTLIGASRTDAGVHATHQIAVCNTSVALQADQLHHAWNNALPLDIMIRQFTKMNTPFNPFHDVLHKTYCYTVYTKRPMPQDAPFGWYYQYKIDIETLKNALDLVIGTHNFLAFSTSEPDVNPIRTVDAITTTVSEEKIVISITGKSFIRHMIRRIIGAAVIVASHRARKIHHIMALLESPSGFYCFETAPAHGLSLEHIEYEKIAHQRGVI